MNRLANKEKQLSMLWTVPNHSFSCLLSSLPFSLPDKLELPNSSSLKAAKGNAAFQSLWCSFAFSTGLTLWCRLRERSFRKAGGW